ncbi:MAG: ATPase, T2SS/T4P/T4SS family [Candidatus Falkowbacteria bacterium]
MLDNERLKALLLKENYLTEKDLARGLKFSEAYKISLYEALQADNIISRPILGQAIAEYYDVPFLDLSNAKIDLELLALIPEAVARTYQFLPVGRTKTKIFLAMADPADLSALHLAEKKLGTRVEARFVLAEDLEQALGGYGPSLETEFQKIIASVEPKNTSPEERDEATIKIVDLLLEKGFRNKASDIHLEPYSSSIMVRFRIDGLLRRVLTIDKTWAESILSRIKIMARLRIDEHRSAQDGKLRFGVDGKMIDVRASIVPISEGENVVLRILSAHSQSLTLPNLGLNEQHFQMVKEAIARPHGMILVTGPTGSGKTTTLYAVLNILNREEVHIATIEDPVEYAIEGISQIQVDPKSNLTFADGLRSTLRQDPDIIMVGEIRDKETAGIAVNSALTGHLVLSTLHTNDAATALPRLIDMDIEPFLIASTVNMIIAQRLVRKNCEKCRKSQPLTPEELVIIEHEPIIKNYLKKKGYKTMKKINVYKGQGCKACDQTGYAGRIGIFEILEINDEIRKLIMAKEDAAVIAEAAHENGMISMLEDGLDKVLSGVTSLDEMIRVIAV